MATDVQFRRLTHEAEGFVLTLSRAPNGKRPVPSPNGERARTRDVLVLGDQERVRSVLCRFLARHGYRSIEASSVNEATTLLAASPVAAVLIEIAANGPGPTLDTVAELRKQLAAPNTPAIVMTSALLSAADRERVSEQHAYLFYKPEGLSALIGFLDQITTQGRAH